MFVPGNNPGMMQDAFIYGPDSIMLDLEDSVTMAEKDAARLLVHNALKSIDYGDTEMVVRINPLSTPYGRKDVEAVVKAGVQVIRMPKTETADEVRELEAEIEKVEKELGCLGRTRMMAAIESAEGICNAFAIAKASKRMMGIALGAEDYCANLKTQRTPEGDALIQREAAAMTRDYTGALAQMDAQAKASADYAPALHALDQSAAEIRHAIATDPQARFLLEQLRRTYARRLALTQRAVMT